MGKGVVSVMQGRISGARWAGGQTKSSVHQGRASSGRCQGRSVQHGVHSGVWSSAVSAIVWSLSQLYFESWGLHPSGPFDKCLCTLHAKCGISPGAYLWVGLLCRHGCSDHVSRYLKCVSDNMDRLVCVLARGVCSDLGSFPLERKCHG